MARESEYPILGFDYRELGFEEPTLIAERSLRFFTSLLFEAFQSEEWQKVHPEIPLCTLESDLIHAVAAGKPLSDPFTRLMLPVYLATNQTNQESFLWLLNLAKDEAKLRVVVPFILAGAKMCFAYVTLKEAGEMSGMTDSPWRSRCQAGEVPGAVFTGGVWLIPIQHMIRLGYTK